LRNRAYRRTVLRESTTITDGTVDRRVNSPAQRLPSQPRDADCATNRGALAAACSDGPAAVAASACTTLAAGCAAILSTPEPPWCAAAGAPIAAQEVR
jgi:hypothetical protein